MRIIQVNKFFYPKGGADRVFFDTIKLLEQAGHQVAPFAMQDPRNLSSRYAKYFVSRRNFFNPHGWREKLAVAGRMIYSFEAKRKFIRLIDHFKPDVVHIHNIYHQISPSILAACRQRQIPVVMTAHDWFLINPNYTRYAHGRMQDDVAYRTLGKYLFDRGIQNSFWKTLFATCVHISQRLFGLWIPRIDRILCPSEFMKQEFIRAGIPAQKLIQLANPVAIPARSALARRPKRAMIFFGRLEQQKGIGTILAAAETTPEIVWDIIGSGSEESFLIHEIKARKLQNVRLVGRLEGKELWSVILAGAAVVVPSEWPENQPLTIVEAQLLGVPVIATNIPSIVEMIKDGVTGFLITRKNPSALAARARWVLAHSQAARRVGLAAQKIAHEKYDPKRYVKKLEEIYVQLINKNV